MKIVWTKEKKKAVIERLEEWMNEHNAYSGEHVMQDDDCQITAPELISDLVDIIEPDIEDNS